jgi:hypothetical protein
MQLEARLKNVDAEDKKQDDMRYKLRTQVADQNLTKHNVSKEQNSSMQRNADSEMKKQYEAADFNLEARKDMNKQKNHVNMTSFRHETI